MTLRLLTLIKGLVPFKIRKQCSRDVSTNAPLGLENIDQTVHHEFERTYCSCATQTTAKISTCKESTHLATLSSPMKSFPPRIPPELICLILIELWDMPQSPEERWASLENVVLVNRVWLALMACIASRDVHIYDKRNASAFIRLVSTPSESPIQTAADGLFARKRISLRANDLCRSITFYVGGKAFTSCPGALPNLATVQSPSSPADDASGAISLVLQTMAQNHDYLPYLRHIAFRYMDVGYEDIFKHLEQEPFPQRVTHLSVHFAFTIANFPYSLSKQWRHTRDGNRRYAPRQSTAPVVQPFLDVRHLSLSWCTTVVAMTIWRVCPNAETLELLVPSPIRLHTACTRWDRCPRP